MKRARQIIPLILSLCLLIAAAPAWAQSESASIVRDDAKFVLKVKPSAFYQSRIGQLILEQVRAEEPLVDQKLDELCATIGIDLRTDLTEAVIFGTGYDQDQIAMAAELGPTAGNINGLLLAAPGYESTVYQDELIIHSLTTDDATGHPGKRVFCAMPKRPGAEAYTLVAAFDQDRVMAMIDMTMKDNTPLTAEAQRRDTLVEAWFAGLPELAEMAEAEGPPSVWAGMIQQAHVTLGESEDGLNSELKITMVDKIRTQQVFEMVRGGLAMMQLVISGEPEAQPLTEMLQMIQVNQDPEDYTVTAAFDCSHHQLERTLAVLKQMDEMSDHDHGDDDEEYEYEDQD